MGSNVTDRQHVVGRPEFCTVVHREVQTANLTCELAVFCQVLGEQVPVPVVQLQVPVLGMQVPVYKYQY